MIQYLDTQYPDCFDIRTFGSRDIKFDLKSELWLLVLWGTTVFNQMTVGVLLCDKRLALVLKQNFSQIKFSINIYL